MEQLFKKLKNMKGVDEVDGIDAGVLSVICDKKTAKLLLLRNDITVEIEEEGCDGSTLLSIYK